MYYPCTNGVIRINSDVLDHMGDRGYVEKIVYNSATKQVMVTIKSLAYELVTIQMKAMNVQLVVSNLDPPSHENLPPQLKSPIDEAWSIYSSIKRAVSLGFEKKYGHVSILCISSEFARRCVGFQTDSIKEHVS